MAKKKRQKHTHRNAAPRAPRAVAPRPEPETPLHRLGYTAAGAAGTALACAFLARQGWAPKTITSALGAVGAGLAWKGEGSTVRNVGAGAMSAAGSQLALMMLDEHQTTQPKTGSQVATAKKPANADELPPGALERAFERAKERLSLTSGVMPEAA
jgi:hypothetical protein